MAQSDSAENTQHEHGTEGRQDAVEDSRLYLVDLFRIGRNGKCGVLVKVDN